MFAERRVMMSNLVMKPIPRGSAGLPAQLLNVGLGPPDLVNRIIQTPNLLTSQVLTFAPALELLVREDVDIVGVPARG